MVPPYFYDCYLLLPKSKLNSPSSYFYSSFLPFILLKSKSSISFPFLLSLLVANFSNPSPASKSSPPFASLLLPFSDCRYLFSLSAVFLDSAIAFSISASYLDSSIAYLNSSSPSFTLLSFFCLGVFSFPYGLEYYSFSSSVRKCCFCIPVKSAQGSFFQSSNILT